MYARATMAAVACLAVMMFDLGPVHARAGRLSTPHISIPSQENGELDPVVVAMQTVLTKYQ